MHSFGAFLDIIGLPLTVACAIAPLAGFILGTIVKGKGFAVRGIVWTISYYIVSLPLLAFLIPVIVPGGVVAGIIIFMLAWKSRNRPPGDMFQLCHTCKFDLTGNASGICPECGATISEDQRKYLSDFRNPEKSKEKNQRCHAELLPLF